jgi:hypothetical protein
MTRAVVRWLAPTALFCLVLLGSPRVLFAQGASEPERVKIPTVDGVELRGFFYKSPKANAPTVLVLHSLGKGMHSMVTGWKDLAQRLQPNYSVMLFDFRGHGESKVVDPTIFWKYQHNILAGKASFNKDTIDYVNFDKTGAYLPTLINDIAAVKGYLDRRSDQGECNTSSFILIGAENGATLGSIWLNSEWSRFRVTPALQLENRPEGKDTIAAIWLSISHLLGKRKIALSAVLDEAARKGATPMVFMYGDADVDGRATAKRLEKDIKGTGAKAPHNLKYTGATSLGKTNLAGVNLLSTKTLKVDAAILKYLDNVVIDKGNERGDHDYRKSQYVWRQGLLGNPVLAKPPGDLNPVYDTYEKFIPR